MTIPNSLYFGLVNFAILVGVLIYFLRRPVKDFFASRSALLQKAVDDAQTARRTAAQQARECGDRIGRVEMEIAALRKQFHAEGELERATIVQRANLYAEKLAADTERMVTQELKRAKEQLRATTVDLAIVMAERYLREQTTPEDQLRLMRQYVERVGQIQ